MLLSAPDVLPFDLGGAIGHVLSEAAAGDFIALPHAGLGHGYLARYASMVSSADEGTVLKLPQLGGE